MRRTIRSKRVGRGFSPRIREQLHLLQLEHVITIHHFLLSWLTLFQNHTCSVPRSPPQYNTTTTPVANPPTTGVDDDVGQEPPASRYSTLVRILVFVTVAVLPLITEAIMRVFNDLLFLALITIVATVASSLLSAL
jgi:hypothetical protein